MECMFPYQVRHKHTGLWGDIPCGKCPACKQSRVSGWHLRITQEEKVSNSSHFITFTYDSKNIPVTSDGYLTLDKYELPLYFKRLRQAIARSGSKTTKLPLKYFAVGEYGSKTHRPHYHALIFNAPIGLLQGAWDKGAIHYGKVEGASIGYTLKYMLKKGGDQMPGVQKEFAIMSKGLGEAYLSKDMIAWHQADIQNRMYCVVEGGKKVGMPRYYKDKIYHKTQRNAVHAGVVKKQKELISKNPDKPDPRYDRDHHEAKKAAVRLAAIKSSKSSKL